MKRRWFTGFVPVLLTLALAFVGCDGGTSTRYVTVQEGPEFDVIIVGAGPAGWQAAVTISDRMPAASIALIEADYFIGGSMNFALGGTAGILFPGTLTNANDRLSRSTWIEGYAPDRTHADFPVNDIVPNWQKLARVVGYSWRWRNVEIPHFDINMQGTSFSDPAGGTTTGGHYAGRTMWRALQRRLTPESGLPMLADRPGTPRNITLFLNTRVLDFIGPVDHPTGVSTISTMRGNHQYFGTTGRRTNITGSYIILATGGWNNNNELGAYHIRRSADGGWGGTGTWVPGNANNVNVNQRDRALAMATMMDANWHTGRVAPFNKGDGMIMIMNSGGEAVPLWQAHNNHLMYGESLSFSVHNTRFVPEQYWRVFSNRNHPFGRGFRNMSANMMPIFNPNEHVLVNGLGLRFGSEAVVDNVRGLTMQMDATPPYYLIVSTRTAIDIPAETTGQASDPQQRFWPALDARDAITAWYGTRHLHHGGPELFRADTLAGLADLILPGAANAQARANFLATMGAYNIRVQRAADGQTAAEVDGTGADGTITVDGIEIRGMGKALTTNIGAAGGPSGTAARVTQNFSRSYVCNPGSADHDGPFYAIAMYPSTHISPGGIRADWRGRIIAAGSTRDNPTLILPNVRSAGEVGNRDMLAGVYPGGAYIALAFLTGHIAGLDIASVMSGGSGVEDLTDE